MHDLQHPASGSAAEPAFVEALLGCLAFGRDVREAAEGKGCAASRPDPVLVDFLLGVASADGTLRRWIGSLCPPVVPPADSADGPTRPLAGLLR